MRSTEVQRKLKCSSSSLATVPLAASSPTVGAVDQQSIVNGGRYGDLASVLAVVSRMDGHGIGPATLARHRLTSTQASQPRANSDRAGVPQPLTRSDDIALSEIAC